MIADIMIGNSMGWGFIAALAFIGLFGSLFKASADAKCIDHWIPWTILVGSIFMALLLYFGGHKDIETRTIQDSITTNYDNVYMYHNNKNDKSFISDNSKYTFEYDEDTKTLIVFKDSDVDAVFVDGIKQDADK